MSQSMTTSMLPIKFNRCSASTKAPKRVPAFQILKLKLLVLQRLRENLCTSKNLVVGILRMRTISRINHIYLISNMELAIYSMFSIRKNSRQPNKSHFLARMTAFHLSLLTQIHDKMKMLPTITMGNQ